MALVDPDDDSLTRYVARYYSYDPDRRERRHVVEAAFDNEEEMLAWIEEGATARSPEAAGTREAIEHYTGLYLEPGDNQRAREKRWALKAATRSHRAEWP
jgi:hypothetical protein